jgi:hypothetical protein
MITPCDQTKRKSNDGKKKRINKKKFFFSSLFSFDSNSWGMLKKKNNAFINDICLQIEIK